MKVLICCECSGVVREEFRRLGHDAWSCDLSPAEDGSPHHHQCDMRELDIEENDLVGFHPPCTFLNGAGIHWNNRGRGWEQTENSLRLVRWCMAHKVPHYLENPVGIISTRIRPPDQYIQPYEFGDDASKLTGLWLHKLLPLRPGRRVSGRWVWHKNRYVERWSNQTDSGQNKLPPSETRAADRSRTYVGIARAMAAQWGGEDVV